MKKLISKKFIRDNRKKEIFCNKKKREYRKKRNFKNRNRFKEETNQDLNSSNLEKKYRIIKSKYKRAINNLNELKNKIKSNGVFITDNKNPKFYIADDIYKLYNDEKYEASYIRTAIKLFKDYQNYISKNFIRNKSNSKIS